MNASSSATVLRHWADLYKSKRITPAAADWSAAQRLVKAALRDADGAMAEIRVLLDRSNNSLFPLCDPLLTDLGVHRWLRAEREEAYSDWLHWILDQIDDAEGVLRLLGVSDDQVINCCRKKKLAVSREVVTDKGRFDLLLTCDNFCMIVELKTVSAEKAETGKQSRYSDWLSKHPAKHKVATLLVAAAQDKDYWGFTPLLWADLCTNLRRLVPSLKEEIGLSKAALVLAFVGAVESNLLHLIVPEEAVGSRKLVVGRTLQHLRNNFSN